MIVFHWQYKVFVGFGHFKDSSVVYRCNGSGLDWWLKVPGSTLGKLFSLVCLCSPSSIIWYQSNGGDVLWLGR